MIFEIFFFRCIHGAVISAICLVTLLKKEETVIMKILRRSGPKIEPCGTLASTFPIH